MTEVKEVKISPIIDKKLQKYLTYDIVKEDVIDGLYGVTRGFKYMTDKIILFNFKDNRGGNYVQSLSDDQKKYIVNTIRKYVNAYQRFLLEGYILFPKTEDFKSWSRMDDGDKDIIWETSVSKNVNMINQLLNYSPEAPPPPSPFPEFLRQLEIKKDKQYRESPIDWEREINEYQTERRRRLSKRNYSSRKKRSVKRSSRKRSKKVKQRSRKSSSRKCYRRSYKRRDGTKVRSTYIKC